MHEFGNKKRGGRMDPPLPSSTARRTSSGRICPVFHSASSECCVDAPPVDAPSSRLIRWTHAPTYQVCAVPA